MKEREMSAMRFRQKSHRENVKETEMQYVKEMEMEYATVARDPEETHVVAR